MKTSKGVVPPPLQFLVLVPHRDARRFLHAWSASLFTAGINGAWSFPWAAPLAQLRKPLTAEQLKSIACQLRQHLNLFGSKFRTASPTAVSLAGTGETPSHALFGHALHPELPSGFFAPCGKALHRPFSPVVLGSAFIAIEDVPLNPPPLPEITFRAAIVANMDFRPLLLEDAWDGSSFEWRIGTQHWLPNN